MDSAPSDAAVGPIAPALGPAVDETLTAKRRRIDIPRAIGEDEAVDVGDVWTLSSELSLPSLLVDDLDRLSDFDEAQDCSDLRGTVTAVDANRLVVDANGRQHSVTLAGEWLRTPVAVGDRVSVYLTGERRWGAEVVVDDRANFLVTDPDTLLPVTLLADSLTCTRRAVLSALTQLSVDDHRPSLSLVVGSLVHSVIQAILLQNETHMSDAQLEEQTEELVDTFLRSEGTRLALYACGATAEEARREVGEVLCKFPLWYHDFVRKQCQVVQVEENLWSVRLGVKGKMDATMYDRASGQHRPLEIKAGKANNTNINHRGQTLLYTLLLAEHYPQTAVDFGDLYYVQSGETIPVTARRPELRGIIQQRNQVARYVKQADLEQLPEMISNEHLCQKCFQRDICLSAFRVKHDAAAEPLVLKDRFRELFPGQPSKQAAFIRSFLQAVTAEEQESHRAKSVLWRSSEEERVRMGRSVHATVLSSVPIAASDNHRVTLRAVERVECSWLTLGDAVAVSKGQRFGVSTGFVLDVLPDNALVLSLDRPLCSHQIYSIDKDELTGSFGVYRANLLKLLTEGRLGRLVCDLDEPVFTTSPDIPFHDSGLDEYQREAVRHVQSAADYSLVIGMPGTGKTSTLVFLIRYIVQVRRESVLLVSHTHAAIDNVLIRLSDDLDGAVLRIGSAGKVHPKAHKYLFNPQDGDNVHEYVGGKRVVAGTTLSLHHHPLLMRTARFEWCIVDEASQLHLPACLGPLRLATRFVLVGDPQQLPPLVKSRSDQAKPLLESLFQRLLHAHPSASRTLCKQYRMNQEIMKIPNQLVYNHQLVCGNPVVAGRRIAIDKQPGELSGIVDAERPVLFVNMECMEERVGGSFQNRLEATACNRIVEALVAAGLPPCHVAVISPYQPQLRLLRSTIVDAAVELATVDRFQGRDFPCVIISLVRCNPLQQVGELLSDWRRINVAFTRAQSKLIVLGSRSTLSGSRVFAAFFDMVDHNGWQTDWLP